MKQWLKKQKYKIAIALCSILSIFTLFLGINKTYAYVTNQFSYTVSNIYTTSNDLQVTTNNNITTISNLTANIYINRNVFIDTINVLNTSNSTTLLLNYEILLSSDNINFTRYTLSPSSTNTSSCLLSLYSYDYNYPSNSYPFRVGYLNFTNAFYNSNNNYYTNVIQYNRTANNNNDYNKLDMTLSYQVFNSAPYWKFIIHNIDIVSQNDIGLQQYYDTYYGQIEQNYNNLLNDYNDLQDDYDTLENNYNTLESNYNTLEDNYTNLLNNVNSMSNMGIMQFINKIDFTYYLNGGLGFYEKTLTLLEVMESDYFTGNFFDVQQFANDWAEELNISNNNELVVEIDFVPIDIDLFTFKTEDMTIIDYRNISLTNDVNNVNVVLNTWPIINQEQIENVYGSSLNNYKVKSLYIQYRTMGSDVYDDNYFGSDTAITQVAYNRGFNMAKQQFESLILELNNKISANEQTIQQLQSELEFSSSTNRDLNTQIDSLETENTRFRYVIASLEAQLRSYQESSNDYNLNRMIWTIASTPFESFKQIWNVDFFGVNISTMITGFITGIIVLWIIKKFFL